MENNQPKLCKDCKYHKKDSISGCDVCFQKIYYTVDVVTGKKIKNGHAISCDFNRNFDDGESWCNQNGKFWEQKPSFFSKLLSYFGC